jgi:hypothetical protein
MLVESMPMDPKGLEEEFAKVRHVAIAVQAWLALMTLLSLALGTLVLGDFWNLHDKVRMLAVCVSFGVLGSAVSAFMSASERFSNGWETLSGDKRPREEPKDKFVARTAGQFFYRPLLGAVAAIAVLVGLVGGYMIAIQVEDLNWKSFRPEGVAFLSLLAGIMAKSLIERLRDMFHALFGK